MSTTTVASVSPLRSSSTNAKPLQHSSPTSITSSLSPLAVSQQPRVARRLQERPTRHDTSRRPPPLLLSNWIQLPNPSPHQHPPHTPLLPSPPPHPPPMQHHYSPPCTYTSVHAYIPLNLTSISLNTHPCAIGFPYCIHSYCTTLQQPTLISIFPANKNPIPLPTILPLNSTAADPREAPTSIINSPAYLLPTTPLLISIATHVANVNGTNHPAHSSTLLSLNSTAPIPEAPSTNITNFQAQHLPTTPSLDGPIDFSQHAVPDPPTSFYCRSNITLTDNTTHYVCLRLQSTHNIPVSVYSQPCKDPRFIIDKIQPWEDVSFASFPTATRYNHFYKLHNNRGFIAMVLENVVAC